MARASITSSPNVAAQYIAGVRGLKAQMISADLSVYDLLVYWHVVTMMTPSPSQLGVPDGRNAAHNGPIFLPWHRLYLAVFEAQLRGVPGVDNDFELPYWDWSADADAAAQSGLPVGTALWNAPIWDLLGRNDESGNVTGEFADNWVVRVEPLSSGGATLGPGRLLQRGLVGNLLPRSQVVRDACLIGTYDRRPWARSGMSGSHRDAVEDQHDAVHGFVGGDMMRSASPNDPVFFLHHCNVDRQWAAWQDSFGSGRERYDPQIVNAPAVPPDHIVSALPLWFDGGPNPFGLDVGDVMEMVPTYTNLQQFQ